MTEFDFKAAKRQLQEIVAIVETCPEPLREKAFELLFSVVFRAGEPESARADPPPSNPSTNPPSDKNVPPIQPRLSAEQKLPSNILAFTRKFDVPIAELQKLFILDHEPLLPVYKIVTKVTATAQLQKVMMILLENGLLNNQLKAPYNELRDSIKEAGLMDGNFNKVLKKNHNLFRGAVTKDKIIENETIELTGEGYDRLAKVVKELTPPAA
jgi:hypothetical protein